MYQEKEIEKLYWTIGECADIVGVAPSCIRFWQKEFDIDVRRSHGFKNDRRFTRDKVFLFKAISEALEFFTLRGLKMMDLRYLDSTLEVIKDNVKECYFKNTSTKATD